MFPPADRCGTTLTRRLHPIHHSLSETAEHGDASAHQSVFTCTIILLSLPQSLFYMITQNPTKNCPYIFLFCRSYQGDANFLLYPPNIRHCCSALYPHSHNSFLHFPRMLCFRDHMLVFSSRPHWSVLTRRNLNCDLDRWIRIRAVV